MTIFSGPTVTRRQGARRPPSHSKLSGQPGREADQRNDRADQARDGSWHARLLPLGVVVMS